MASLDAYELKVVSDDMGGNEAGDQMHTMVGSAMRAASMRCEINPYFVRGYECYITGNDDNQVALSLAYVAKTLNNIVIGRGIENDAYMDLKGPEFSVGKVRTGDAEHADRKTGNDKARKVVA